ncbi:hypothetical protein L1887_25531 [Cichorium endivia]|nr:hypothetical protein L1887_25531 [Cichorium endivia]
MDLGENDRVWLLIRICVSNWLKTVTFKNFHANDSEICFLKHVLKYARVLERMNICWSKTPLRGLKKQTKVMKELETIERSSTACVLYIRSSNSPSHSPLGHTPTSNPTPRYSRKYVVNTSFSTIATPTSSIVALICEIEHIVQQPYQTAVTIQAS